MNKRATILIAAWLALLVIVICLLLLPSHKWTANSLLAGPRPGNGSRVPDGRVLARRPALSGSSVEQGFAEATSPGEETALWEKEVDRVRSTEGEDGWHSEVGEAEELCALLSERLGKGESEETIEISERIVAMGDEATEALANLANSGNPQNEIAAVRLLCRIGTTRAIAVALGRILAGSPDAAQTARLLEQFAGIRNPSVSSLLVEMMGETEHADITERIGPILNVMEGPFAVRSLAAGIAEPINAEHRQNCISALAGMQKPSNVSSLAQMLTASEDSEVNAAIAEALARIGNRAACDTLAEWAGSGSERSDIFLAALSTVSSPYGQQALFDILDAARSVPVRTAAAQALGNYTSADLRKRLTGRASSEESEVVRNAMIDSSTRIGQRAGPVETPIPVGVELIEMSDR